MQRRRAECMASIQSDAVQLALDLLVREPDIDGFFRAFIKTLVEESESHACGVWLLDDDEQRCDLWMAHLRRAALHAASSGLGPAGLPRERMAAHLFALQAGWQQTIEYRGDDPRLPERGARVQRARRHRRRCSSRRWCWRTRHARLDRAVRPATTSACERRGACALLEAIARQATLALHQSRLAEQSRLEERRKAVLEERNRLARDIHDTLAQGFGAILMQLQAAQRDGDAAAAGRAQLDTAVDLARTHMVEARRSVGALRPNVGDGEDLANALKRLAELAQRTSERADRRPRSTSCRAFGDGVEREIIGIAQEALTNAVRHSRAQAHRDPRVGGARDRLPAVGGRRWPRHRAGTIVARASA